MPDWPCEAAAGPGALPDLLGEDAARYEGLVHPAARARFAASRALLKYTIAAALGPAVAPHRVELGYRRGGRPFVRGPGGRYTVSLSHTENELLVGVCERGADGQVIGVDVERADRELYGAGLARLMCAPGELARLERAAPASRNPLLVRWWTRKEAYSKAIGQGLGLRFTGFDADAPAHTGWFCRTFTLTDHPGAPTYTAAVAIGVDQEGTP
ncbi:4'-phosphopantetheinyl transferase family protein [Streptomyces sp. NPDC002577]